MPPFREHGQLAEHAAVRPNEVEARQADREQRRAKESEDLPLHLAVDALHTQRGLVLAFIVGNEEARDGRAERGLPRLERHLDLHARVALVPFAGEREHARRRVPELGGRGAQVAALFGRPARDRHALFPLQRVCQIQPDPIELRGPGRHGVVLVVVQDVSHRERDRVEIVLDAQQLQGVFPVPIGQIGLQRPEARYLPGDVPRVRRDRGERDDQAEQQPEGRRPAMGGIQGQAAILRFNAETVNSPRSRVPAAHRDAARHRRTTVTGDVAAVHRRRDDDWCAAGRDDAPTHRRSSRLACCPS